MEISQKIQQCVICFKELEAVSQDSNIAPLNTEAPKDVGRSESAVLHNQLSVILLLRKFFDIPKIVCSQFLQSHGNPSQWLRWCSSCSLSVKEAEHLFHRIKKLEFKLEELIREMKNTIAESNSAKSFKEVNVTDLKEQLANNSQSFLEEPIQIVRSLVSKQVSDLSKTFCDIKLEIESDDELHYSNSLNLVQPEDPSIFSSASEYSRSASTPKTRQKKKTLKKSDRKTQNRNGLRKPKIYASTCQDGSFSGNTRSDSGGPASHVSGDVESNTLVKMETPLLLNSEKPYFCTTCGKTFKKLSQLNFHERLHFNKNLFFCSFCSKPFVHRNDFRRHEATHARKLSYESVSSNQHSQTEELTSDQDTEEGNFSCKYCEKSFMHREDLRDHKRSHSGQQLICGICKKGFRSLAKLKIHEQKHNQKRLVKEKRYCCTFCGKIFFHKNDFLKHERTHTGEKIYSCDLCGKRFGYAASLAEHQLTHTGEKPFECLTCGRRFTRKGELRKHAQTHSEEKPFLCTACGKAFRQNATLKRHQEKHTAEEEGTEKGGLAIEPREWPHIGGTKYSCSHCGKPFKHRNDFLKHERTHTGEKPYTCPLCSKQFSVLSQLNMHRRIHTGELPFGCSACGKKFVNKGVLKRHQLSHSEERPFSCSVCDKRFKQKAGLQRHENSHTKI